MLDFLFYPQEGINYEFIFQVYLVCVALFIILYILEKTELMVIAKGLYIVFIPFTVSTLWALYMRLKKLTLYSPAILFSPRSF